MNEAMRAIGEQIRTQDNACTSHPMFLIQRNRRIYGMDPNYSEDFTWIHQDDCEEVAEDERAKLEAQHEETGEEASGYRRVAYIDLWEFVTAFFTRAAAEQFLIDNAHRFGQKRIYVDSGHRNPEWQAIRAYLKEGVCSTPL